MSVLRDAMRKLESGESVSDEEKMKSKRNVAYACKLALEAGTRLFNQAGGRALFTDGHLQRQYRNLLGGASHHAVVWEDAAVEYGAELLRPYGAIRGHA